MSGTQKGPYYPILDLIKAILTIGIVFRHAELVGLEGQSVAYDFLNHGMMLLTSACVPIFFVLAGYLYFRNVPERPDARFFWQKTRNRFSSLLVPYLIANAIAFVLYWLAHHYSADMVSGYFGDNWTKPLFIFWTGPINMSLWFIRDLIICCFVAPLIYLLVRYTRIWGVIALGAVWIFWQGSAWYNVWFALGAWAAVCQGPAVDRLLRKIPAQVPAGVSGWCFFVYLYHYVPSLAFKKLFATLFKPDSFLTLSATYWATALIVLAMMTGLYIGLRSAVPRLTRVLVGGKR